MMTDNIIPFNDWQKLDLRVARIKNVEDIENADKLYKLTLDVGNKIGERTVCAGIKQHYTKKELKGKKVIVFTNLAPRVMKGITSEGMILAAVSDDESQVVLLSPEKDVDVGWRVK